MSADNVWESEREAGGSGFLGIFAGGLGILVIAGVVVVAISCCCCTLGWGSFVRFGIGEDLEDFRISARGSDLPQSQKDSYVRRFEDIEDRLDSGELEMSFLQWVDASVDIEEVFADGRVESWELPVLEEAVRSMER